MFKMLGAAVAAVLALSGVAVPAAATQYGDIAEFTAIGTDPNFEWVRTPGYNGGGTLTSIATAQPNVNFQFRTPGAPAGSYPQQLEALFALNALGQLPAVMTVTSANVPWEAYDGGRGRPFVFATLTFTYAGADPLVVDGQTYNAGANLLTVGPTAYFSPRGGEFPSSRFSSDFLDLSVLWSVAGGGVIVVDDPPPVVIRDGSPAIDSFAGRFAGGYFYGAVPEPATWAMMIAGFGVVGSTLRRSRTDRYRLGQA